MEYCTISQLNNFYFYTLKLIELLIYQYIVLMCDYYLLNTIVSSVIFNVVQFYVQIMRYSYIKNSILILFYT